MGIDGSEIKRRKEKLATAKTESPKGNIYIAMAAIVIAVIWIYSSSQQKPQRRDYSSLAFMQCQTFVTNRLKSPSTADFPFADYTSWKGDDGKYTIKSYVDAQNGFGAIVRSYWHCETTYTPGNKRGHEWKLVNLEISN